MAKEVWVEEGKSSSGYKLINWIHPESQPSALIKRETGKHGSDFAWECRTH